jgi:hypothetical protein
MGSGSRSVRGNRVTEHIIDDYEGAAQTIEIALSATLAVLRVCYDGFVLGLIETEDIHGTDRIAVSATDARFKVMSLNTHFLSFFVQTSEPMPTYPNCLGFSFLPANPSLRFRQGISIHNASCIPVPSHPSIRL